MSPTIDVQIPGSLPSFEELLPSITNFVADVLPSPSRSFISRLAPSVTLLSTPPPPINWTINPSTCSPGFNSIPESTASSTPSISAPPAACTIDSGTAQSSIRSESMNTGGAGNSTPKSSPISATEFALPSSFSPAVTPTVSNFLPLPTSMQLATIPNPPDTQAPSNQGVKEDTSTHSRSVRTVVGSTIGAVVIVVCALVVHFLKRRGHRQTTDKVASAEPSMFTLRTRKQSDIKSSPRQPALENISDREKPASGVTRSTDSILESQDSMPPRVGASTSQSHTPRGSDHNSRRRSTATDVFRDPSSGLPYVWAPTQHDVPSFTRSISSSEIPWQLSIVHTRCNPSQESWSSSEELTPLHSPVVL